MLLPLPFWCHFFWLMLLMAIAMPYADYAIFFFSFSCWFSSDAAFLCLSFSLPCLRFDDAILIDIATITPFSAPLFFHYAWLPFSADCFRRFSLMFISSIFIVVTFILPFYDYADISPNAMPSAFLLFLRCLLLRLSPCATAYHVCVATPHILPPRTTIQQTYTHAMPHAILLAVLYTPCCWYFSLRFRRLIMFHYLMIAIFRRLLMLICRLFAFSALACCFITLAMPAVTITPLHAFAFHADDYAAAITLLFIDYAAAFLSYWFYFRLICFFISFRRRHAADFAADGFAMHHATPLLMLIAAFAFRWCHRRALCDYIRRRHMPLFSPPFFIADIAHYALIIDVARTFDAYFTHCGFSPFSLRHALLLSLWWFLRYFAFIYLLLFVTATIFWCDYAFFHFADMPLLMPLRYCCLIFLPRYLRHFRLSRFAIIFRCHFFDAFAAHAAAAPCHCRFRLSPFAVFHDAAAFLHFRYLPCFFSAAFMIAFRELIDIFFVTLFATLLFFAMPRPPYRHHAATRWCAMRWCLFYCAAADDAVMPIWCFRRWCFSSFMLWYFLLFITILIFADIASAFMIFFDASCHYFACWLPFDSTPYAIDRWVVLRYVLL